MNISCLDSIIEKKQLWVVIAWFNFFSIHLITIGANQETGQFGRCSVTQQVLDQVAKVAPFCVAGTLPPTDRWKIN